MRKRGKRLAAAVMAAVMAAAMMPGCGKKATPENLFSDMSKNVENMQSANCNLNLTIEMSDGTAALAFFMDMDLGATADPQAFYGKGQVEMNAYGTEETQDMEIYQVREGNEYVTYTLTDGVWNKNVRTDDTEGFKIDLAADLGNQAELFEMAGDLAEVNGRDCFEMNGNIGGDAIPGMLREAIMEPLAGLDLDEATLSDVNIPCTIDVYRDGILPARIFIDMSDMIDTMAGAAGGEISVSMCSLELIYEEYNCVDEIRVPEEAVTAEENGGYSDYSWDGYDYGHNYDHDHHHNYDYDYDYGYDYDFFTDADPAEPGKDLGEYWETYTVQINDRVLTLPCSIEDLEAAGLVMDTEDMPEDYTVDSKDYELVWFNDAYGNTLMIEIFNMDAEEKPLLQCKVGGVNVSDYDVAAGSLAVFFPGAVQIGTHIDDVLAAYGEADDVYEGNYSNTYYWFGDGSFYDACIIDVDPETNQVTSMSISHYI